MFEQLASYSSPRQPVKKAPRVQPQDPRQRKARAKNLTAGDVVGEWTLQVFEPGHHVPPPRKVARWKCLCSCGTVRWVSANSLTAARRGDDVFASRSCGHREGDE